MKILVLTQKVDVNDDLLGFFHGWLAIMAEKFEQVTVICLQKGEYRLPPNVAVYSLGKEKKQSRLMYVANFYRFIWQFRRQYSCVFVHMNAIYVALGGLFWKIMGKKIILWYIHPRPDKYLKIAIFFCDKIVSAAPGSFPLATEKINYVGHGINLNIFKKEERAVPQTDFLFVGRISPVKNLIVLAGALSKLYEQGNKYRIKFVGGHSDKDRDYYNQIRSSLKEYEGLGLVKFSDQKPNWAMPEIYNQTQVLLNLTQTGSFDKAILEAMACEVLVLVANTAFIDVVPAELIFKENNSLDLAEKMKSAISLSFEQKRNYGRQLRRFVLENHNLDNLIEKLKLIYESIS